MILRDQHSFPLREACVTLQWPCVWRDCWSDNLFAFGLIAHEGFSFCRRCTSHSHSHKWKHSYTNSMFSIFLSHLHSSFAFALRTSEILALDSIYVVCECDKNGGKHVNTLWCFQVPYVRMRMWQVHRSIWMRIRMSELTENFYAPSQTGNKKKAAPFSFAYHIPHIWNLSLKLSEKAIIYINRVLIVVQMYSQA